MLLNKIFLYRRLHFFVLDKEIIKLDVDGIRAGLLSEKCCKQSLNALSFLHPLSVVLLLSSERTDVFSGLYFAAGVPMSEPVLCIPFLASSNSAWALAFLIPPLQVWARFL